MPLGLQTLRNTMPLGSLPPPTERAQGDNMPPMICRVVFEEMCVLANGDIVCSCADPTGLRIYGNVLKDRIDDIFNGSMYQEIRDWQLRSSPTSWCPVIDSNCAGRVARASATDLIVGRQVKMLQLEPISYCNLRCPACPVTTHFPDPELRGRADQMLPLETMLDVIDQLPCLETLLFYNFGEPFLHKDTIPFLQEVRRRRPEIFIAISTNALPLNSRKIETLARDALVDKFVFAIDGAIPENYAKYRVGGELNKALHNMTEFVRITEKLGTRKKFNIQWQYILFEWNDGDAEIELAKSIAAQLGVEIDWKLTHTPGASKRFLAASPSFLALTGQFWNRNSATCEVQLQDFLSQGGIAEGRYLARITPAATKISGKMGQSIGLSVKVENLTRLPWNTTGMQSTDQRGQIRVGMKLLTAQGRQIREISGAVFSVNSLPPGGIAEVIVRIPMPDVSGKYQIMIDLVDEHICWFSERGSAPAVCEITVLEMSDRAAYGSALNCAVGYDDTYAVIATRPSYSSKDNILPLAANA